MSAMVFNLDLASFLPNIEGLPDHPSVFECDGCKREVLLADVEKNVCRLCDFYNCDDCYLEDKKLCRNCDSEIEGGKK